MAVQRTGDLLLEARRWGLLSIFSDEEELFLREEAADSLSLEEVPVTVSAALYQTVDCQAVRLFVVRRDVVLMFELSPQG